jgi:hypothetical protein
MRDIKLKRRLSLNKEIRESIFWQVANFMGYQRFVAMQIMLRAAANKKPHSVFVVIAKTQDCVAIMVGSLSDFEYQKKC